MIVEFQFSCGQPDDMILVFFSLNFPDINFNVGDELWISEFKHLLHKGEIWCSDGTNSDCWGELSDVDACVIIESVGYGCNSYGVIKLISATTA